MAQTPFFFADLSLRKCMIRYRYAFLIFVLLPVSFPVIASSLNQVENQIQLNQKELKAIQQDLLKTQNKFKKSQSAYEKEVKNLQAIEEKISVNRRQTDTLEKELLSIQERITALKLQQEQLLARIEQQKVWVTEEVQAAYRGESFSRLKALFTQDSPQLMGQVLTYGRYYSQARSSHIEVLSAEQIALAKVTEQLQISEQESKAKIKIQQKKQKEFDALKKQQQAQIKILKNQVAQSSREAESLDNKKTELTRLLDGLVAQRTQLKSTSFTTSQGRLPWPLDNDNILKVSERFGQTRQDSGTPSNGIKIKSTEGESVKAVAPGRVIFSGWLLGYGLLVILDHGDRFYTLYGHNQSVLKEVGDAVKVGESIALIGKTGGSNQEELYFEIRRNGKPLDPLKWLAGSP
ncbi:MAG: peptidoglycan DD-metalloendopeptidase family protein [Pseudomonadota bacterium]